MADETLKVRFVGDDSSLAKASADATKSLSQTEKAVNNLSGALRTNAQVSAQAVRSAQQMSQSAASAGGAIEKTKTNFTGLNRVVQDLPFGFIAISNNLEQLLPAAGALGLGFSALVSAITFAQVGLSNWGRGLFSTSEASDKLTQSTVALKEAMTADEFVKTSASLQELKINIDLAKQGLIDKEKVVNEYNETLGKASGKVKTLDEAEQGLVKNGPAYLQMILLQAAAHLALDKAAKKAVDAQIDFQDAMKKAQDVGRKGEAQKDIQAGTAGLSEFFSRGLENEANSAKAAADKRVKTLNDIAADFQKQAAEIATKFKFDFFKGDFKTPKPTGEKPKHQFLFDFLPFDPNGNLKPEQRGQLLDAINKFQKEVGGLVKGVPFTGNEEQVIKQAFKIDAEIKSGKINFNLDFVRTELIRSFDKLKDEDILPQDKLQTLSTEVSDEFVRTFQNISDQIKNKNPFNLPPGFDLSKDLAAQVDLFKVRVRQLGAEIPKTIQGINTQGKPVELTFEDLFDTSKIANNDALKALQEAFDKIKIKVASFPDQLKDLVANTKFDFAVSLGQGIADAINGGGFDKALESVASVMGDFIQQLGKLLIKEAITVQLFQKAFASLLKHPALAIAVGIGMIALGGIIKNAVMPKPKGFAQGGLVSGPTLGLVGEGIGTSRANPEVIAPLDKLRQFINPNPGSVAMPQGEWRLRGKDLVFVMSQTQKSQRRAT